MFATIEFLGRERDKERFQEAEQIRLVKTAAKGKPVRFDRWGVRSLLVGLIGLSLAAVPALANTAPVETELFGAGFQQTMAPCTRDTTVVLGREGGLLSLLGVDGHSEPVSAIVLDDAYSPLAVHNGQSVPFVVYVRTDC